MLVFDHIAICCSTLEQGVAYVEKTLGVTMVPGGQHERYGTHNKLLRLGDDLYLEVIAKVPTASPPNVPRWFDLDRFTGAPRLANWICSTQHMTQALQDAPPSVGKPCAVSRGGMRWTITVPDDGSLPYGGGFPTLIEWGEDVVHPVHNLPSSGCKLIKWVISHPQAPKLRELADIDDPRVFFVQGAAGFSAEIETPSGMVTLT